MIVGCNSESRSSRELELMRFNQREKRREGHVYCSLSKMSTSPTQMLFGAKPLPDLREITESSSFLSVSKVFGAGSTNLSMHLVPNSRSASVETSTSNASKNTNTASIGPPSMLTTDIDSLMVPALKNELSKRNLPISGKKTVLVKSLKDHIIQASRKNAEKDLVLNLI